jgi:hypothetical protein
MIIQKRKLLQNAATEDWDVWKEAIVWGFGVALVHRFVLQVWSAITWNILGSPYYENAYNIQAKYGADLLPPLSAIEDVVFGIWRRWDAVHYLRLANEGYTQATVNISVFPPITPFGISFFDSFLPGGSDAAAIVFNTLMFALVLIFLFRICEVYFNSNALARWSVCTLALLPLSYFFAAPMAESAYMATSLGCIYFAIRRRWLGSALWGFLAGVARSQGILLLLITGIILLEKEWDGTKSWKTNLMAIAPKGLMLAIIPTGFLCFVIFRWALEFPSLGDIYYANWGTIFVNPLEGLWINARWLFVNLPNSLLQANGITFLLTLLLIPFLIIKKEHRKIAFIVYTLTYLALLVTPISFSLIDSDLAITNSIGRYCLALFPLTILLADMLRHAPQTLKITGAGGLGLVLLMLTALNTIGLTDA